MPAVDPRISGTAGGYSCSAWPEWRMAEEPTSQRCGAGTRVCRPGAFLTARWKRRLFRRRGHAGQVPEAELRCGMIPPSPWASVILTRADTGSQHGVNPQAALILTPSWLSHAGPWRETRIKQSRSGGRFTQTARLPRSRLTPQPRRCTELLFQVLKLCLLASGGGDGP